MTLRLPFGIKINAAAAMHTWVGRRATRWLEEMFEALGGHENFRFLVQKDRDLLPCFPPEAIVYYKATLRIDKGVVEMFTDEEVYGWVPEAYKKIIESEPNGPAWCKRQLDQIRSQLMS